MQLRWNTVPILLDVDQTDLSVPVRLPHFHRQGDELYFLCSRRPAATLAAQQWAVWDLIDGRRNLRELNQASTDASAHVARFVRQGLVCLLPPPGHALLDAPRALVVEPHMDDAALSVGGTLLKQAGRCRATILSVVRRSNYTSYVRQRRDFLDTENITELRIAESTLAAAMLGADFQCLDWVDAPNRLLPGDLWTVDALPAIGRAVEAFVHAPLYPDQVERLAGELNRVIEDAQPDTLWLPMALGDHVDHRLVHEAGLLMLARRTERGARVPTVWLYEDLPYATQANAEAARRRIQAQGWSLHRHVEDVSEQFELKLQAVGVYASQFKLKVMEKRLRTAAHAVAGMQVGRLGEVRYRLERDERMAQCHPSAPGNSKVFDWVSSNSDAQSLSVVVLPSGHLGEWHEDMTSIRRAFPAARVQLLIADELSFELARHQASDPRVSIVRLPQQPGLLARALLREVVSRPRTPRVWVHWGGSHDVHGIPARLKRRLLEVGPSVQVATLPELTSQLERALSPTGH